MLKGEKAYAKEWFIEGDPWLLKFVNALDKNTLAECDPSEKTNYIKRGQSKIEILEGFFHEFIHSAEVHYKFNLKHDHVHKLDKFLAAFLVENWDSFKKLMG